MNHEKKKKETHKHKFITTNPNSPSIPDFYNQFIQGNIPPANITTNPNSPSIPDFYNQFIQGNIPPANIPANLIQGYANPVVNPEVKPSGSAKGNGVSFHDAEKYLERIHQLTCYASKCIPGLAPRIEHPPQNYARDIIPNSIRTQVSPSKAKPVKGNNKTPMDVKYFIKEYYGLVNLTRGIDRNPYNVDIKLLKKRCGINNQGFQLMLGELRKNNIEYSLKNEMQGVAVKIRIRDVERGLKKEDRLGENRKYVLKVGDAIMEVDGLYVGAKK